MAKKVKDLLRVINGFLNNQEIETIAAASSLDSVEVTEEGYAKVLEAMKGFLTQESAINNPEIRKHIEKDLYPRIKGELLGNVDTEFDGVSKSLFGDEAKEILDATFTKDKVRLFGDMAQKLLRSKLKDEDKQKIVENYSKQINELNTKHAADLADMQKKISDKEDEFKTSLIKNKFKEITGAYNWQPAYVVPEIKDVLIKNIYDKISSKVTLKMAPTGEIEIFQKENPNLIYYEGAKVPGIKDLIDPEVQPYITKAPQKPGQARAHQETVIVTDKPTKLSPLARRIQDAREEYQTH